jgi:membrane protein implicated in regulation of membrane protease activity
VWSALVSSRKKTPAWETVAVFGAIFSLWPAVLEYWAAASDKVTLEDLPLGHIINWAHPAWDLLMYAAFALMVIVAVRRVRRVRKPDDENAGADSNEGGPIDPYGSMFGGRGDAK